jgi:tRNA A-37 threonylcarbamoyl transferase component Bud32
MISLPLKRSQNLTGCTNCNIIIPQTIAKALKAKTESEINLVIKEHEANHSYSDPHLQSDVDAILLAIKSNITKESIDYDLGIRAIEATKLLLEQYGKVEPGPNELALPPSIAALPRAMQAVLTTLPVRGSIGAGKIKTHLQALDKMAAYLRVERLKSNPSNWWTRFGRSNFHNANSLARKWNDLVRRKGQIVEGSNLALDAVTHDSYELNDAITFDKLATAATNDNFPPAQYATLPTIAADPDITNDDQPGKSIDHIQPIAIPSNNANASIDSFISKDLNYNSFALRLNGETGSSITNSMTLPVASPVLRKLFILDEILNLFTIYPGIQSVSLDTTTINRIDISSLHSAISSLNTQFNSLVRDKDPSLDTPSTYGAQKLIDDRYIISETSYNSGGMGTVSLGWDKKFAIPIIIKTINKDSSLYKQYLKQEAIVLGTFKNRKIPSAYDIYEENDVLYYVMEYVSGPSLFKYTQTSIDLGQPLSTTEVLDIVEDISITLDDIHSQSFDGIPLAHADIKPGNIAINARQGATILDFGIANAVLRKVHGVDNYKKLNVYTPMYYAPSQQRDGVFRQEPRHDNRSLILIAFSMITGSNPYQDDKLMINILNGNWNRSSLLSKINQNYSANIQDQIMEFFNRAMIDDDTFFEEYPTAQSISNELYRLLSQTKK